jgi:hypothetical protein
MDATEYISINNSDIENDRKNQSRSFNDVLLESSINDTNNATSSNSIEDSEESESGRRSCCSNVASTLFHDQRKAVGALYIWLAILLGLFAYVGIGDSSFMHFGPSPDAKFMSIAIDNWSRWSVIAVFQFCNTFINIFVSESMWPWIQNTIQDHKNKYLPYSKSACMWICQTYYLYGNIVSMFGLFAMFVQVDFMLIRTLADILVSYYTTNQFLRLKVYDADKYREWFNEPNKAS